MKLSMVTEFLTECADIYKNLIKSPPSALPETVVVPTSETADDAPVDTSADHVTSGDSTQEGVDSMQFFRALAHICETGNIK